MKIIKNTCKWIGLTLLAFLVFVLMQVPAVEETPAYEFENWSQFNEALKQVNFSHNVWMTIIFTIITLVIEWYLCKWAGNKLNFRKHVTVKNISISLLAGILSFIVGLLAVLFKSTSSGTKPTIFTATLKTSMGLGFLIAISSIVIGPILEELLFQGAIQKGFFKKLNPWVSILLTAIIFAACHNIALDLNFLSKIIAGVLYGYVYQKTDDIKMAIIAHGTNNLIVTILLYIQVFL